MTRELFRALPSVDRLLAAAEARGLADRHPRLRIAHATRGLLDAVRERITVGEAAADDLAEEVLLDALADRLEAEARPYYHRVVNATGVVLHTGLGRAPLADEAAAALAEAAAHPQRLEIEPETGERGGRDRGVERLVCELTGAEAATVVNNNAAATLLLLAALARGREVVISRGELVEIGGSYRVPDVMAESGARQVEVGTTNRTHLRDYRRAIGEETGLLLKVHTSNYRVVGFTAEVDLPDLVSLGREHGIPVAHDLGSGSLLDLAARGLPGESTVRGSIQAGADLVCFSGDKLLGGPQAGILAGSKDAVAACRRHPLFRAFRPGRLVYTALEATLRIYTGGEEEAAARIPPLRALLRTPEQLEEGARALAARLAEVPGIEARVVECAGQAGSGSMPARDIPGWGVALLPGEGSAETLAAELRRGSPSIFGRITDGAVLLNLRTLEDDDLDRVVEALAERARAHASG